MSKPEKARLGIGMFAPQSRSVVYDFSHDVVIDLDERDVLAVADPDPVRAYAFPALEHEEQRMAANPAGKLARFPLRKKKPAIDTAFETGYTKYAHSAATFWREHGVGTQPLWAAGVFSLSSIQTPIVTALKLFKLLGKYVALDALPAPATIRKLVKESGAGLDDTESGRPAWYRSFYGFRETVRDAMAQGARDDQLRRYLATEVGLPHGLGLAKLSFTLALVGNNLGCLDARIVSHAFTPQTAEAFLRRVSRRTSRGTVTDETYDVYRSAELSILRRTSFFDSQDPVGLARSQWMLWESLGTESDRTHTHEELFAAVQDPRLLNRLHVV